MYMLTYVVIFFRLAGTGEYGMHQVGVRVRLEIMYKENAVVGSG